MKAIEFVAHAKQGKVEIPQEYIDQVSGEFRVILLLNQQEPVKPKRKRNFKALSVKTKNFKLKRDDIYEG